MATRNAKLAAPAARSTKSVLMEFTKSTKGTHVYAAHKDSELCTQVYLKKDDLPEPPPQRITLSVEFDDE